MQDHAECKCAICEARAAGLTPAQASAAQTEWEKNAIAKFGFYVHYLCDDRDSPTGYNAHTHGMEAFGNLDFQLVIPLPAATARSVISNIAERVMNGEKFSSGQLVSNIIKGFDIKLIEVTEDGRKVLRIILPDKHGKLDQFEISGKYNIQYKDISPTRGFWNTFSPVKT